MIDFIKKQWFVAVIAIILLAFITYFIIDTNKAYVKGKKVDGEEIVASIDNYNLSADELYKEMYDSNGAGEKAVIAQFKHTVINEAVPTTNDLKKSAELTMENAIQSVQAQYKYSRTQSIKMLESQMHNSFFNGTLEEFFLMNEKESEFMSNYLDSQTDDLVKPFMEENQVRTISHILVKVNDVENPTAEEQAKMDAVKAALAEGKDFGEVAKEYSDDALSAEKDGYLGYSDKNSQWVKPFLDESLKLNKGESSSEWVKVSTADSQSYSGFHLVKVLETDADTILEDSEVKQQIYTQIKTKDTEMLNKLIWDKSQELGVTFATPELEKAVKDAYSKSEE